jgi:antitoxin PrlF
MILPKDIREKANIKAGDKLALLSWGESNDVSCIALVKVDGLNKLVQKMLQPVFDETVK